MEQEKTEIKEIVDKNKDSQESQESKIEKESQESQQLLDDEAKEQDRFLPIANITRIMRRGLPKSAKISKDAKETIQECVSEFISFITSE